MWDPEGWIRTRKYGKQAQETDGWFPYSAESGYIFVFDNAICLSGIVCLHATAPDRCLIERATRIADNLAELIVRNDGKLPPIIIAKTGEPAPVRSDRWSRRPGSFLTKVAEALVDTAKPSGKPRYESAARKLCDWALAGQQTDGRFVTDEQGGTQLHPHCYAAEGLLHVGRILGEKRYIDAAKRATLWALGKQNKNGSIPQDFDEHGQSKNPSWCRTDAVAQVLRLASRLLLSENIERSHLPSMHGLARYVLSQRDASSPRRFRYGHGEDGAELSKTLSYWTNSFAFNALLDYLGAWAASHTSLVVLAGGMGTRSWPASCETNPKPVSRAYLGDRSLLQETVSRLLRTGCVLPSETFIVVSTMAHDEACAQLAGLDVPKKNIITELKPLGTIPALRLAIEECDLSVDGGRALIVSMADNLLEPLSSIRFGLLRAILATQNGRPGVVVSLGIPTASTDSRFGHAVYSQTPSWADYPRRVNRFKEKPKIDLPLSAGEAMAWDVGCIVSSCGYVADLLENASADDIPAALLEPADVQTQVLPFPPHVRFVDFGTPSAALRQSFIGTSRDRGLGNIVLGSPQEVRLVRARQNLVISNRDLVEVVSLDRHLIIDSSETNVTIVVPLDKVQDLPTLCRMHMQPDALKPYFEGGAIAQKATPYHETIRCRSSDASSDFGLMAMAHCHGVVGIRRANTVRVVGRPASDFELRCEEVDVIVTKHGDQKLARHLIDVAVVGDLLGARLGFPSEVSRLLRWACLLHDFGGFLNETDLAVEKSITDLLQETSRLDWRTVDSSIVRALIINSKRKLSPQQLNLLTKFNDSVASALAIIEIPALNAYKYRDELIYLVANQERPSMFRQASLPRFALQPAALTNVFCCLKAADIWVNANSAWKWRRARRDPEDMARCMSIIFQTFSETGVDSKPLLKAINEAFLDRNSPLMQYTASQLRFTEGQHGATEAVGFCGTNEIYRSVLTGQDEEHIGELVERILAEGTSNEVKLLGSFPKHVLPLLEGGHVTDPWPVGNLVVCIMKKLLKHKSLPDYELVYNQLRCML